jgi:hypothetical protein
MSSLCMSRSPKIHASQVATLRSRSTQPASAMYCPAEHADHLSPRQAKHQLSRSSLSYDTSAVANQTPREQVIRFVWVTEAIRTMFPVRPFGSHIQPLMNRRSRSNGVFQIFLRAWMRRSRQQVCLAEYFPSLIEIYAHTRAVHKSPRVNSVIMATNTLE